MNLIKDIDRTYGPEALSDPQLAWHDAFVIRYPWLAHEFDPTDDGCAGCSEDVDSDR